MPADPRTRSRVHVPSPALDRLEALTDRWLAHRTDPPTTALALSGVDPVSWPLTDPADPLAPLIGFRAPSDWDAFGVAARGSLSTPSADPSVRLVHLCDRHGTELTTWMHRGVRHTDDAALGRIPDLCKRVLGCPTAPPGVSTRALFAILWLTDVLAEVLDRELDDPLPGWDVVASLHLAGGGVLDLRELVRRGFALADECPWAILRRQTETGRLAIGGVEMAAAAWMDDGMFSRWVLGQHLDLTELVADLHELLPAATTDRIDACLDAWGVS